MKKDIIMAFRVEIDGAKLGLQYCSIDVYLKDYSKRTQILDYVTCNSVVCSIMDMTIGWSDFLIEVMVENIDGLNQITDDIERKFPGAIRKTNFWMSNKVHKERWLPEIDFKEK
jgi:hypothetical protein